MKVASCFLLMGNLLPAAVDAFSLRSQVGKKVVGHQLLHATTTLTQDASESTTTATTDDDDKPQPWGVQDPAQHDGALVVKAPLKYLGPYAALGLRFPNLSTQNQRKNGSKGVSLDFSLDTACNTNTIQQPIAQELEVPTIGDQARSVLRNLGDTQLEVMDELFLTDLGASALPGGNPNAAGTLSLAFLKLFPGGVEFDWTGSDNGGTPSLTFYGAKTKASVEDKKCVPIEPLRLAGGLPSVTLMIQNNNGGELVPVKALLSTGSPITVMNDEAAKLAGVDRMKLAGFDRNDMQEAGNIVTVQNPRTGQAVDLIKSMDLVRVQAKASVAGDCDDDDNDDDETMVDFGNLQLYVGEIPSLQALTSEFAGPAMILGLDVLVQRRSMLLRAQDNELWFD